MKNKLLVTSITMSSLIICMFFFVTCKKEYSYEGSNSNGIAGGTAVYTFNVAGEPCINTIVTGNYYAGTALDAGNSVAVEVDVLSVGIFIVSTNLIDDIHFTGNGIFTDTGKQTILLTGSGKPLSADSFDFEIPGNSGCFFSVLVDTAFVPVAGFTLAGAPFDCGNIAVRGTYIAGSRLTNSNTVDVKVNVTLTGSYSLSTDSIDGIKFSASGIFTTTGIQTVTLMGNGIPEFPRNLIFTPSAAASVCTFTLAVINPPPAATYVLESGSGNPSPCIYAISGIYTSQDPLTISNTISMHVYVTGPGNFTVATDIINGMLFSYTGCFTNMGSQQIILKGTGTPAEPGTYTFIPQIVGPHPLGGEACAVPVAVN